jgi:hypothetical protein
MSSLDGGVRFEDSLVRAPLSRSVASPVCGGAISIRPCRFSLAVSVRCGASHPMAMIPAHMIATARTAARAARQLHGNLWCACDSIQLAASAIASLSNALNDWPA